MRKSSLAIAEVSRLRERLGISSLEEWYTLGTRGNEVRKSLSKYGLSLGKALEMSYPNHDWKMWRFGKAPKDYWDSSHREREHVQWVGEQLGVKTLDDWHSIDIADVRGLLDSGLFRKYEGSLYLLLCGVYPQYRWQAWRLGGPVIDGFWDDLARRRDYFAWLGGKLRVEGMEGWYGVRASDVRRNGGAGLLDRFGGLANAMVATFPDHVWQAWRFEAVPKGFWEEGRNRRDYLDWLGEGLDVARLEDWKKVTVGQIQERGGGELLRIFNGSLARALADVYPSHSWEPWRYAATKEFWEDVANQRQFVDYLTREFAIQGLDDWYNVSLSEIKSRGGDSLLNLYEGSLAKLLSTLYPDHSWQTWRLDKVDSEFWSQKGNQRNYMDWLAKELGIKHLEDWYAVQASEIWKRGGYKLLDLHGHSLANALSNIFPEYRWQLWRFKSVPKDFWQSVENQREFFACLGEEMSIKQTEDWRFVTADEIRVKGGGGLLDHYNGILPEMLAAVFPEVDWSSFALPGGPKAAKLWESNLAAQRDVLGKVSLQLGLKQLDEWYNVKAADVRKLGDSELLQHYGGSVAKAVMATYPEHDWKPWKFAKLPQEFWNSIENQQSFFDWLSGELNLKNLDDWYSVKVSSVREKGDKGLLRMYDGSLGVALSTVYPNHPWKPWKFGNLPSTYWDNAKNQRTFMDWASTELKIKRMDDWYNIVASDISRLSGVELLNRYGGSLFKILKAFHPTHGWQGWRFGHMTEDLWEDRDTQKRFFEWLAGELKLKDLEGWYHVSATEVNSRGGSAVLSLHGGSLFKALAAAFPQHEFLGWKFSLLPKGFWDDEASVKQFLRWLSRELRISSPDDWKAVTWDQVAKLGGTRLLQKTGGLKPLLSKHFPEIQWDQGSQLSSSKGQHFLFNTVRSIFVGEDVKMNFKHPQLKYPDSGISMEVSSLVVMILSWTCSSSHSRLLSSTVESTTSRTTSFTVRTRLK